MPDDAQSQPSDAVWSDLCDRAKWIAPIREAPRSDRSRHVRRAMRELGLCRSSIYNLLNKFDGDTVSSLTPAKPGPEVGQKRLPRVVEEIIERLIGTLYAKPGMKVRVSALVMAVVKECAEASMTPPARSTIQRRIKRYDARKMARRRGEHRKADALEIYPGSKEVLLPNEEWQIDHSPGDVQLVGATGEVIGRAWLTFIIDVATRMIAAVLATLDPPQASNIARALSLAILPKEEYLAGLGVTGCWPICGKPYLLGADNARVFAKAAAYRHGCQKHLIDIESRREGEPQDGAQVERLIGTMVGRMRLLPGATLSSIHEREKLDPAKFARIQLADFSKWLVEQVLDYHDTFHKGLGCTPLQAWTKKCQAYDVIPRIPTNKDDLFIDFLLHKSRAIERQGVSLNNFEYYGEILRELKSRATTRVTVWYDVNDLSVIFAKNGKGGYDRLPIRYSGVPAFALWEVQAERQRRRRQGLPPIGGLPLVEAVLEARGQVRVCGTTLRQHRWQERLREHGLDATEIAGPSGPWAKILAGGLDV